MSAAAAFARDWQLSSETAEQFVRYAALLRAGQARTNLVSAATLDIIWTRHFADCAQLLPLAPAGARWLDMGAGAGFPGLVLALLGASVTLVEATAKKAAFLDAAIGALGLRGRARVYQARLEALSLPPFEAITARALAPLPRLFDWGLAFAAQETRWILPKGATARDDVRAARSTFAFEAELRPSITAPDSAIVIARQVRRLSPGRRAA